MRRANVALVAIVAVLAHAGALSGGFAFDDHQIVERNPRLVVRSGEDLARLLSSNWWGPSAERSGERLFRPLPLLTFAIERRVAGAPSARLSRAVDVALHVLASLVVLALFGCLLKEPLAALAGALLFAAHPLHSEAVSGIVGRAEVLALALGALALFLHRSGTSLGRAALAGIAFFLALCSKESAVAILPMAFIVDAVLPLEPGEGRRFRSYAALSAALVLYIGLRAWALGALVPQATARTLGDMPLLGRAAVALATLESAWLDVLLPLRGTSAHYPLPGFVDPKTGTIPSMVPVLPALLFQDVLLVVAFFLWKKGGVRGRAVLLGLVGFETALLPVLNLIPIGVVYAERLLYAPSMWACLAVAVAVRPALGHLRRKEDDPYGALRFTGAISWLSGWERLPGHARTARVLMAVLIGAAVFTSSHRDRAWGDDRTLWETTVQRFPGEPRALLSLGEVLTKVYITEARAGGRPDPAALEGARECLQLAIAKFPDEQPLKAKAFAVFGEALRARMPLDPESRELVRTAADEAFGRAIALRPEQAFPWMARGLAHIEDGRNADAVAALWRARACAPESDEIAQFLAQALLRAGDPRAAIGVATEAIALAPSRGEARFVRFQARWSVGDRIGALEDYAGSSLLLGDEQRLVATVEMLKLLAASGKKNEAHELTAALAASQPGIAPELRKKIDEMIERIGKN